MGLNNYKHTVNISSSRGCPSNCIYCAGTAMSGGNYRIRNIENVILEVILLSVQMSEDVKTIYFIDDTFTIFRDRVECFIELREKLGIKYKWRCESRIDAMDEEIIDKITENGCYAIQFGIESGSQSVLNNIRKNINLDYAQKIIKYISTKNVLVCLYLMLGHYCDTKETMDLTYQFIKDTVTKYNVDVSLHYNTPYPGTWQYTHRDRLGMKLVSDNYKDFLGYEPIVETSQFTVQDQYDYYFRCKEYLNINGFGYYDN